VQFEQVNAEQIRSWCRQRTLIVCPRRLYSRLHHSSHPLHSQFNLREDCLTQKEQLYRLPVGPTWFVHVLRKLQNFTKVCDATRNFSFGDSPQTSEHPQGLGTGHLLEESVELWTVTDAALDLLEKIKHVKFLLSAAFSSHKPIWVMQRNIKFGSWLNVHISTSLHKGDAAKSPREVFD